MKKLIIFGLILFVSCSKDTIEPVFIAQSYAELNYDKTFQIKITNSKNQEVAATKLKWSSSDPLIGKVDSSGKFTARKIGDVKINGSNGIKDVECTIKVVPYSTLYAEPVIDFGVSISEVKSKEKRVLLFQNDKSMSYAGENSKIRGIIYIFENNKLTGSAVLLNNNTAVAKESLLFLAERYPLKGVINNIIGYFNDTKNIGIALTVDNTLGFVAIYLPHDTNKRATYFQDILNEIKKVTLLK